MGSLPNPKFFLSRPSEQINILTSNTLIFYLQIFKSILTLEAQLKLIPKAASVSNTRGLSLHFTAKINFLINCMCTFR